MAQEDKEKKKVKLPTAKKRQLQNVKRRMENRVFRSRVRTAIRHFQNTVVKGDASLAQQHLNDVYSLMDKGVKLGNYKENKASRTKARLTARCAAIAS